ncbi:M23 family metallopeptidase [Streptomyces sp. HPF1205]|uniref:M23 family metallopeptidase n=1 Tax=Streptomyces sp. HPF1205 TaxID=2873262 RepID=UPI001CEC24F6|nr:M23 family metallopeptidase [Streptomyces sp. HPF1205]
MSGYPPGLNAHEYDAYSTGSYRTAGTTFPTAYSTSDTYGAPAANEAYQAYEAYDPYGQGGAGTGPAPEQSAYEQFDQTNGYGFGYGYPTEYGTGYDQTGTYAMYDPYAYATAQPTQQATGTASYDTASYDTGVYDTGVYDTGTYDSTALWPGGIPQQATQSPQADWDSGGYPAYGYGDGNGYGPGYEYGYGYDANGDTGIYEQLGGVTATEPSYHPAGTGTGTDGHADATATAADDHEGAAGPYASADGPAYAPGVVDTESDLGVDDGDLDPDEHVRHDYAADGPAGDGGGPVARSRRRKPAKRSALLTIAVPSVAVMGVAAVGAAAVGGVGMAQGSSKAQADAGSSGGSQPTTQLDRQLSGVSRDADDFATRASRTQQRLDLKDRQAAAAKAKQEAAARKEALRPKFVLPVTQKGLSAYFGQAGEHWMMLHTGIDFPVQVGTPVMAATDGTVRTQWNPSYGNMAIVTAPDGTETWYCHLSSTKIRSGKVKAGTVIAYSGNTGNTTGPHLHFEVRPDGGRPIDPLPWLLAHGLDPR